MSTAHEEERAFVDDTEFDRSALLEAVRASLSRLDGSRLAAVALMTGFSIEEVDALGGLDDYQQEWKP